MSQSLPQPPRAQGASFAVAPGRVVSADQLRLLSLQLQILDSLVNNAPRAGRAVVATHQGERARRRLAGAGDAARGLERGGRGAANAQISHS
eukprot:2894995-Pleurochrysis_carterae.AAC.1